MRIKITHDEFCKILDDMPMNHALNVELGNGILITTEDTIEYKKLIEIRNGISQPAVEPGVAG